VNAPSFQRGVKRCPSPIIFCDCKGPCSQYPDLRERERVVTHAGMTRTQTNILLVLGLVIGLAVLYLYFQSEDRAAIASMDYSRCHSQSCAAEITRRLTGN
jgi:hypothetical protein